MTTPVEMATLSTGPGEALAVMVERHFRHLPVVDHNCKLLGMLSIRNVLHVKQAAMIGADVVTVPPAVLRALVSHPLTDKGLEQFLSDWKKTGQRIA